MMPLWRLERRPYGLSLTIYVMTVGELLEGCSDEAQKMKLSISLSFLHLSVSGNCFQDHSSLVTDGPSVSLGSDALSKQLPKPLSNPDALSVQGLENSEGIE